MTEEGKDSGGWDLENIILYLILIGLFLLPSNLRVRRGRSSILVLEKTVCGKKEQYIHCCFAKALTCLANHCLL